MEIRDWIEAYGDAWRKKDDAAVAALFTEDGIYRSSPFREPFIGREEIAGYWRAATRGQEEFELRLGEPVVEGDRATVEWWATMSDAGWAAAEGLENPQITLPGCLILRFTAAGLCEELREYWHVHFGEANGPHTGWGA